MVSVVKTKLFAYKMSFIKPFLASFVTTSITIANNKGDNIDPWCIPTFTKRSSDNFDQIRILVIALSYRLIIAFTSVFGKLLCRIDHSITFLGTLSKVFSISTNTCIAFCPYFSIRLAFLI